MLKKAKNFSVSDGVLLIGMNDNSGTCIKQFAAHWPPLKIFTTNMKKYVYAHFIFSAVPLLFAFCSQAQSTIAADSISLLWERLDGPPAYVSQYVQQADVLFASSEEALFSSFDLGQHWDYNEVFGRKRIRQLFANSKIVLALTEESRILDPENPFFTAEVHQVYRSLDAGVSWEKVLGLVLNPEPFFKSIPYNFWVKNDSVIFFNYLKDVGSNTGVTKTLVYRSENNGKTWTDEWNSPQENAILLQLNRDTFSYIKYNGNNAPLEGKITGNSDFSGSQTISLTALDADQFNTLNVAYLKSVFYVFLKDKTLWRTADRGLHWQSDTLSINGTLEQVIWADSVFFLRTSDGVYQGNESNPVVLIKVYAGEESNSPFAKTFSPLKAGFCVNTIQNQTLFSQDGQNWGVRSNGLSSKVGQIRADCGTLRVQSLGSGNDVGGWYHSNQADEDWHWHNENESIYGFNPLGTYGGYVFRYKPGVERSSDCGETWETLEVAVNAQPNGLVDHHGRIFLYTALDIVMHYSDDYGDTWTMGALPNYGIGKMYSIDQHLVGINGHRFYRSADDGLTWDTISVPEQINGFFLNQNNLFGTSFNASNDGQVRLFKSTDLGTTWLQTSQFVIQGCSGLTPEFAYATDSLIFMHNQYDLFVSGDQGLNWTEITPLPFTKRLLSYCSTLAVDTFAMHASRYFANDGYIYAGTESQGLWRTSVKTIYDHLFSAVALKPEPSSNRLLQCFPNPASDWIQVKLTEPFGGISPEIIKLYTLDGRLMAALHVNQLEPLNDQIINIENWAPGLYFLVAQSQQQSFQGKFFKH